MSDDINALGPGGGSANEGIKVRSRHLRGAIRAELESDAGSFSEQSQQLLKFHGTYQQDDRDRRKADRAAGREKSHQFMVRTRIPGGVLTPEQYLAHDDIADAFGNGTLRFTTRQGIQLHGVLKGDLRSTIAAINRTLLSTLAACGDVNRNVMTCPAPPSSPVHERVANDAHALAMHLAPRTGAYHEIWLDDEKLAVPAAEHEPLYGPTYLPRKFKIALALPDDNCVDAYTQDICFVAEAAGDDLLGYTALIGGGMGSTHGKSETYPRLGTPLCFLEPRELLEIAATILTIYRDYGDRQNRKHARMKYVVEERGIAWFRTELQCRIGRLVADPRPVRFRHAHDHLGWHSQANGRWCLGVAVENGRVADRVASLTRSGLRAVIERFSPGIRITPQQNILLVDVAPGDRHELDTALWGYGVETNPRALGLHREAMACPALPTCGLAVAEAERALPEIVDEIEGVLEELDISGERIGIRMTGCPNGCARPRMGDVGIVGRSLDLYDVFLGGDRAGTRLNELFAAGVPRAQLATILRPVLARWKRERIDGESFGDFAQRAITVPLPESAAQMQPAAAAQM